MPIAFPLRISAICASTFTARAIRGKDLLLLENARKCDIILAERPSAAEKHAVFPGVIMRHHRNRTEYRFVAGIIAATALAGLPAVAAAQDEANVSALEPLKACQAETDPATRLACYDAAVGAVVTAEAEGDLRVIDRETVRKTRRSLFGFSLPDFGIFGGGDDDGDDEEEEQFTTLTTTVASVRYMTPSAFVFRIADGNALWQVSDAPRRLLTVESGDKVEIKQAALGSFFISFNGQGGVKGRRIE